MLDGFGPHFNSLVAMMKREAAKALSCKEEGDSSHVNQAHDKFVAKEDKSNSSESLGLMRRARCNHGKIVDQWGLVHVVLHMMRATKPDTWTRSFQACNLDPRTRVPFSEWCNKTSSFSLGGQTFKEEDKLDPHALLPGFWHGMTPAEKKVAVALIDREGGFTVKCVKALEEECSFRRKDLNHVRVCYELAKANPQHLERGILSEEELTRARTRSAEEAAAKDSMKHVTDGLSMFQLTPQGLKGIKLFKHMIQMRHRTSLTQQVEPSGFLDCEIKDDQREVLDPSSHDLTHGQIMKQAGGKGARLKVAKRKLDNLGYVKSFCGVMNSDERMNRMKNNFELAASLAEIDRMDQAEKADENVKIENECKDKASGALSKLRSKNDDVTKLTKLEMGALLFVAHNLFLAHGKTIKKDMVASLKEKIRANDDALQKCEESLPAAAAEEREQEEDDDLD